MTPNGVDEYLSTELPREEPVKAGYLAPEIELIDFTSCPRHGPGVTLTARFPSAESGTPAAAFPDPLSQVRAPRATAA